MVSRMEVAISILTILTLGISLIVAVVKVGTKISEGIENRTRKVLVETGLIRELRPGEAYADIWPNSWGNLPDTTIGLWQGNEATEAKVHELEGTVRELHKDDLP